MNRALAAEWAKARTIRSTVGCLAGASVLVPVLAAFVGATGSLQPDDTVAGGSLTGVAVAQLLVGVFGTLVVTSEHTAGTVGLTYLAEPRRPRVLAAKALLVAAVTVPAGLVACATAYAVGAALLDGYPRGDLAQALVGVPLCLAVSAVGGLALGAVVRRTAGAIAVLAAIVLVPPVVGPLLGGLRPWLVGATPPATLAKLSQTSDATAGAMGTLGGWPSLAALAAVTLAGLALAARVVDRRDA